MKTRESSSEKAAHTIDDIANLKAALEHPEQHFVERSNPKPMEKLARTIHLLELGCHQVEYDARGLHVNGSHPLS